MSRISNIFDRRMEPQRGDFSPEHAKYVLGLKFTKGQLARYNKLASRHNDGLLDEEELAELDALVNANMILILLQAKARLSLKQHPSA